MSCRSSSPAIASRAHARPRKGQRARAVESRNSHGAAVGSHDRAGLVFIEGRGEHRSFSRCTTVHELRPQHDYPRGMLQTECSRDTGGSNFSDAVANHGSWPHTPGFPKFCKRQLHRKNRRLSDLGPMHLGSGFLTIQLLQQGILPRTHGGIARLDRPPKNRLMLDEFASHAPPLRSLAAHDEGDARRLGRAVARKCF